MSDLVSNRLSRRPSNRGRPLPYVKSPAVDLRIATWLSISGIRRCADRRRRSTSTTEPMAERV
jgi:hypothetical protein